MEMVVFNSLATLTAVVSIIMFCKNFLDEVEYRMSRRGLAKDGLHLNAFQTKQYFVVALVTTTYVLFFT